MQISLDAVRDFINDAVVLVQCSGRWYKADSPMAMHAEDVSYTTEDLTALDYRIEHLLPELVRLADAQLKGIKADDYVLVYGTMLRNTIEHWESQKHLLNSLNQRVYYKELNAIDASHLSEGGLIMLSGFMCEIEDYRTESGIDVPYVRSTPLTFHWVTKAWLDSTHPGWETRLEVCESLGYESAELMRMVLAKESATQNTISLNGITLSPE